MRKWNHWYFPQNSQSPCFLEYLVHPVSKPSLRSTLCQSLSISVFFSLQHHDYGHRFLSPVPTSPHPITHVLAPLRLLLSFTHTTNLSTVIQFLSLSPHCHSWQITVHLSADTSQITSSAKTSLISQSFLPAYSRSAL